MRRIPNVIKEYYFKKFSQYKDTPKGVDWADLYSQYMRFEYIYKFLENYLYKKPKIKILDVGCGYGAFYDFISTKVSTKVFEYYGVDLVANMIKKAQERFPNIKENLFIGEFLELSFEKRSFDVVIASGIFNVKSDLETKDFYEYIKEVIIKMYRISEFGIIFNTLSPSVNYKESHLFYPDFQEFFDFLYKGLSRDITIITSYPLWELTYKVNRENNGK